MSQTGPCGFGPPGSHIGTVLNVYAAAGSARTNDFIDNSQPCDHKRKLCESCLHEVIFVLKYENGSVSVILRTASCVHCKIINISMKHG